MKTIHTLIRSRFLVPVLTLSLLPVLFMTLAFTSPSPVETLTVVRIEGMEFLPKITKVHVGETVRWVNDTYTLHNVVSNDGLFKSPMLEENQGFSFRFIKPGIYKYYCKPHRLMGMKGQIIVE